MKKNLLIKLLILSLVLVVFEGFSSTNASNRKISTNFNVKVSEFLRILGETESNNNDNVPGDNGKALGRYQIWHIYFKDAVEYDKSLQRYRYYEVTNKLVADKVVAAYLKRYSKNLNPISFEEWAKIHNGGPSWSTKTGQAKKNLDTYWSKFKRYQKLLDAPKKNH